MPGYITDQQINTGLYVPTTYIFDLPNIDKLDLNSPEFKEIFVKLYQNVSNMNMALNNKDSAYYITEEFVNGQQYFNPTSSSQLDLRPVFRKEIDIGALAAGVTTIAHNLAITNTWKFTRIYGVASDSAGFNYYPLPWASAAGATNIELKVNIANVVITNNSGVAFTDCYVTLEYVKF